MATLTALAASTSAVAQSSVTLFGIVDATVAYGKGSNNKLTQLTTNGLSSTQLGFRGTEDLGGGLAASFWIEAGFNADNGTGSTTNTNNQSSGQPRSASNPSGAAAGPNGSQGLTFNRRSTVSLSGGFGELRLGRDYTPQFRNLSAFDPFGTNGVGTTLTLNGVSGVIAGVPAGFGANGTFAGAPGAPAAEAVNFTGVRASNSVGYFLPGNLGGFYGEAKLYLGENASNAGATRKDGSGFGVRAGYANGPINAALAISSTKYAPDSFKTVNLGGSYDLGMVQVLAQYSQDKYEDAKGQGLLIGGLVPVGAGQIRVAYSTYKVDLGAGADPKSSKLAIGYVHNLSKRTALYTTYAHLNNKNGASMALNGSSTAANKNSDGIDLGIRHSF